MFRSREKAGAVDNVFGKIFYGTGVCKERGRKRLISCEVKLLYG